jgi:hypothetical protein
MCAQAVAGPQYASSAAQCATALAAGTGSVQPGKQKTDGYSKESQKLGANSGRLRLGGGRHFAFVSAVAACQKFCVGIPLRLSQQT